jgi:nucleotide-binding universal stress UspA family protein
MFKKILVALDGSSVSENALHVAVDEARIREAELHALYVVRHVVTHTMLYESDTASPEGSVKNYNEIMENEAKKVLGHAEEVASDEGVPVITHFMIGDPREIIVDFSEEMEADLIIVGSSGKSSLDRFLLGSVSSAVVEHSAVTTIVVRN